MSNERITSPGRAPRDAEIAEWIGVEAYKYWTDLTGYIEREYPGIFMPEWLFGGKKHGWSLRYKKSKSFCTLIPERPVRVADRLRGGRTAKDGVRKR